MLIQYNFQEVTLASIFLEAFFSKNVVGEEAFLFLQLVYVFKEKEIGKKLGMCDHSFFRTFIFNFCA